MSVELTDRPGFKQRTARLLVTLLLFIGAIIPLLLLAKIVQLGLTNSRGMLIMWFNSGVATLLVLPAPLAVVIAFLVLRAFRKPGRAPKLELCESALICLALALCGKHFLEFASWWRLALWCACCAAPIYINSRSAMNYLPQRERPRLRAWAFALTPLWSLFFPRPLWGYIGSRQGKQVGKAGEAFGALLALALVPCVALPMFFPLSQGPRPGPGVTRLLPGSFYMIERDPQQGTLFVTSPSEAQLVRIDPDVPEQRQVAQVPTNELQTVTLNPDARELLYYCRMHGCADERRPG
ncbi:MAG: hypothetical protein P9M14_08765, partial [Candidatus Alcyoniella australis]|nr:hypothetical protein [Candidatus Alcyoniella australis]